MSSFKVFIFCLCLMVAGCGFTPMYGDKAASTLRPDIEIVSIPDRDGQYLRNLLIDRLYLQGTPADTRYQLVMSPPQKTVINIGIRKDASATRAQMQIDSKMQLIEKAGGKVLMERDFRIVGAYNLLDDQLATIVSRQSITENMLREMADDVVRALDLHFRESVPQ